MCLLEGVIRGGLIFGGTYVWTASSVSYKAVLSERALSTGFKSTSENLANIQKYCSRLVAIFKKVAASWTALCEDSNTSKWLLMSYFCVLRSTPLISFVTLKIIRIILSNLFVQHEIKLLALVSQKLCDLSKLSSTK